MQLQKRLEHKHFWRYFSKPDTNVSVTILLFECSRIIIIIIIYGVMLIYIAVKENVTVAKQIVS